MLRSGARQFLADKFGPDRVAELAESDEGWDRAAWAEIAGLGWTSLSVPEEHGGAGMTFLDEAVVFEETGRALYPGPYFSTVGLALPALAGDALAGVVSGEQAATLAWAEDPATASLADLDAIQCRAEEATGEWHLTGTKILVPDLGAADVVVVAARTGEGVGLFATAGGDRRVHPTVDGTRRLGTLVLDRAPATLLVAPGETEKLMARIRDRALTALALEAVGVAQTALDLAHSFASERQQFGRPIGVYQAVAHQVADMYRDVELARSLAYFAAWCVAEGEERAASAVPAAKAVAAEAAMTACERSIQIHGGIGFTWEHILHRYYKRAHWIAAFDARPAALRAEIAARLLDD